MPNRINHNLPMNSANQNVQQTHLLTKANDKHDSIKTASELTNTKLDILSGAINNNLGDAQVKLQTYVYAHDGGNGQARPLQCDANGHLKVSNDVLEVSAETVNLNTDTLETKIQATNDKLDGFSGAGNNNIGEGQTKLQTYLYARDVAAGNFKPLVCDGDAHLQVDCLTSALPTGAATESTLNDVKTSVELLDDVVVAQNAAHPSKANAVGGRYYVDNTFRDIRVDSIGKVIVDSPSGSDINLRIDAISNGQTQNGDGTGNKPGVMLDAINTNIISLNNKFVGGQTTSGMATAQNQQVVDLTLQGLGDDLTDIKNAQTQNGDGTGNKPGVMLDAINTNTITGNSTLSSINTNNELSSGTAGGTAAAGQKGRVILGFDGSNFRNVKTNTSGQLQIDGASVVSVAPSNSFNSDNASHLNSFAVGIRARTNISSHSTGTFLLCDSDGRLAVINKTAVVNHSEVSYVSGQSISGSGTHTGASISVDANTKAFYVEHNFSHTGIKYEILASIDGTNFFSTGTEFNAGGLSPATLTGINTIKGASGTAEGFPPFIKFKFTNSDSSVQSATLSYVQQIG
tara:strand:+ start:9482 stop:11200 length:1719 start_codon:yes stop_codon:yes gene_type:complete